jgi:transposase
MRKKDLGIHKARVAIETVCGMKTISEFALYEVHPNQVSIWKKHYIESASSTFSKPDSSKDKQNTEDVDVLYRKIGKLEVENEFLKKSEIS